MRCHVLVAFGKSRSVINRGFLFIGLVALTIILGLTPSASAEEQSDCVTAPVILPLLGGEGDAPLIPVKINGKPAAMYVSPAFDYIYVRNSEGIQFPKGYDDAKVVINGTYKESAFHSKINELVLDDIPLKDVDVVLLAKASTQMVDGRPIVGVLGRAALSRLAVLIDIPERQFAYLDVKDTKACKLAFKTFLGNDSHSVDMEDDFTVHIRVGEKKKRVSLDPDLTYTTFPSFWISSLKENLEGLGDQKKFTHYDDFLSVGQGALVKNLFMGGAPIENEKVVFQDEVEIGSLGLPFFTDKIIIWSLENNRMYFAIPAHMRPLSKGQGLHFFATHSGNVSVRDRRGDVQ